MVVEPSSPRLCSIDGVPIEAPLSGTLVVMANDDKPGVIGDVGTAMGRHGVNIGSFALGRDKSGAVGVISIGLKDRRSTQQAGLLRALVSKAARAV